MKPRLNQACRSIITSRLVVTAVVVAVGSLVAGFGDAQGRPGGGGPQSAPPEALAACKTKSVGDACSMSFPRRSEAVSGTCISTADDQVACLPEGAPRPPKS